MHSGRISRLSAASWRRSARGFTIGRGTILRKRRSKMSSRPKVTGIMESALYVADLDRSLDFYQRVFGFPTIVRRGDRVHALRVSDHQILLLFLKGCCRKPYVLPNGKIPS